MEFLAVLAGVAIVAASRWFRGCGQPPRRSSQVDWPSSIRPRPSPPLPANNGWISSPKPRPNASARPRPAPTRSRPSKSPFRKNSWNARSCLEKSRNECHVPGCASDHRSDPLASCQPLRPTRKSAGFWSSSLCVSRESPACSYVRQPPASSSPTTPRSVPKTPSWMHYAAGLRRAGPGRRSQSRACCKRHSNLLSVPGERGHSCDCRPGPAERADREHATSWAVSWRISFVNKRAFTVYASASIPKASSSSSIPMSGKPPPSSPWSRPTTRTTQISSIGWRSRTSRRQKTRTTAASPNARGACRHGVGVGAGGRAGGRSGGRRLAGGQQLVDLPQGAPDVDRGAPPDGRHPRCHSHHAVGRDRRGVAGGFAEHPALRRRVDTQQHPGTDPQSPSDVLDYMSDLAWVERDGRSSRSRPRMWPSARRFSSSQRAHPGRWRRDRRQGACRPACADRRVDAGRKDDPRHRLCGDGGRRGRAPGADHPLGDDTQVAQMVHLVQNAPVFDNRAQDYAERWANRLVPYSFLGAGIMAMMGNFTQAITLLVIDYAAGFRVSAPTAIMSTITKAARHGILIRGGPTSSWPRSMRWSSTRRARLRSAARTSSAPCR